MKMERKIKVTYFWDTENDNIPDEHEKELERQAEKRILDLWKQGYSEGELNEEIEGSYYRGWWSAHYDGDHAFRPFDNLMD
jgi:hypothetical protein